MEGRDNTRIQQPSCLYERLEGGQRDLLLPNGITLIADQWTGKEIPCEVDKAAHAEIFRERTQLSQENELAGSQSDFLAQLAHCRLTMLLIWLRLASWHY